MSRFNVGEIFHLFLHPHHPHILALNDRTVAGESQKHKLLLERRTTAEPNNRSGRNSKLCCCHFHSCSADFTDILPESQHKVSRMDFSVLFPFTSAHQFKSSKAESNCNSVNKRKCLHRYCWQLAEQNIQKGLKSQIKCSAFELSTAVCCCCCCCWCVSNLFALFEYSLS